MPTPEYRAKLHDSQIAELEADLAKVSEELNDWTGWAQMMLKAVKGDKIVHGSLGHELEMAIGNVQKERDSLREQVRKLRGAMEWIGGVSTDHHQGQHSFRDLMVCANEALRESEEVK